MIDEKKLIEALKKRIRTKRSTMEILRDIIPLVQSQPKVGEWIPCSERLPEDCDNRFYMCVVENHEEDPPMYCQYEEDLGFGFWCDVYDEHTLGFVDSYFRTNEEFGYESVIAWMQLPESYNPEPDDDERLNE